MNYPLQLSFEVLSIARKLSVIDAAGNLNFFVKQKAFKLKESVTVFADADQKLPLYELAADRFCNLHPRVVSGRPINRGDLPSHRS